jgi:hypothetical protein
MGIYYFYGFRSEVRPEICALSDGLSPPADLVPDRLCRGATVCFGCILIPPPSPPAAEYFHLVAPGPVLGRIPKKGHLKKGMFGLGARCVTTSIHMVSN